MAMIFQSYALWPHLTVARNVGYGLRFKGELSRDDRERRVREMLRVVQLEGYGARYPGELSGGQQQRVAVARALVVEPEVLLLDEPLSNLDAHLREEMRFEIRRLHETFGITTLYVTHDQAEAMVISDKVAVMQAGAVAQLGTADELFNHPRTRFVAEFIGKTNVLDGVAVGPDIVACGDVRLRVARAGLSSGSPVALSIRPHQIALLGEWGPPREPSASAALKRSASSRELSEAEGTIGAGAAAAGGNTLRGTVQRASFLGDSVDYQIAVADSPVVLRVTAPSARRLRTGERVELAIDPGACIPLADGAP
jgi:ABC-type Fe3+/spermidine/putrescine transport system ATPase subunit